MCFIQTVEASYYLNFRWTLFCPPSLPFEPQYKGLFLWCCQDILQVNRANLSAKSHWSDERLHWWFELPSAWKLIYVNTLNLTVGEDCNYRNVQWNRRAGGHCTWWCHCVFLSQSGCLCELRLKVFLLWPHLLLERRPWQRPRWFVQTPTLTSNQNSLFCHMMTACRKPS